MENALIIFVRNLEKGKVKTRLAKELGDEKSLEVYKHLLQYTRDTTCTCHCNLFVFYSSYVHINDVFDDNLYSKHVQQGDNLGERMLNAFEKVFQLGCKRVCVIGSDCYELDAEIIQSAFEKLADSDAVIGPSRDGGYYLIGMNSLYTEVFKNKDWGTSTVLDDTIQVLKSLNVNFTELPVLNDIDTMEDLLSTDILTKLEEDHF